jgi:hypothetical protein
MILFRQKYPRSWFDWNRELLRFSNRVGVYLALMDDTYPSTDERQSVALELEYPDGEAGPQSLAAAREVVPGDPALDSVRVPLARSVRLRDRRLGGYWSVTRMKAEPTTRFVQRNMPRTKSKSPRG